MSDIVYIPAPTGLTITVNIYQGNTNMGSFAATEISSTGLYFGTMPSVGYGYYALIAIDESGNAQGYGTIYWDGVQEISPVMYNELWKLQGLDINNPMTVTPTVRSTDDIKLDISGDGVTETIVQRQ